MSGYSHPLPWLRLYTEFAHDPKVQRLPETIQRRFVMVLCLTGLRSIPTSDDEAVAFALRVSLEEAAETKKILLDAQLIRRDWYPKAWVKRQPKGDHTGALRQRKHRASKAIEGEVSNGGVTRPSRHRSRYPSRDRNAAEERESRGRLDSDKNSEPGSERSVRKIVPKTPKTRGGNREARRNGDFEQINRDVLKVVREGGIEPAEVAQIAKMLHITEPQAAIAISQLRDRGEIPGAAPRMNA